MFWIRLVLYLFSVSCIESQLQNGNLVPLADDVVFGNEIPGTAGIDYPIYDSVPRTSFSCDSVTYPGYYADQETGCQGFHICDRGGRGYEFLCPNGTLFSQEVLVCDWWFHVRCEDAFRHYDVNQKVFDGMNVANRRLGIPTVGPRDDVRFNSAGSHFPSDSQRFGGGIPSHSSVPSRQPVNAFGNQNRFPSSGAFGGQFGLEGGTQSPDQSTLRNPFATGFDGPSGSHGTGRPFNGVGPVQSHQLGFSGEPPLGGRPLHPFNEEGRPFGTGPHLQGNQQNFGNGFGRPFPQSERFGEHPFPGQFNGGSEGPFSPGRFPQTSSIAGVNQVTRPIFGLRKPSGSGLHQEFGGNSYEGPINYRINGNKGPFGQSQPQGSPLLNRPLGSHQPFGSHLNTGENGHSPTPTALAHKDPFGRPTGAELHGNPLNVGNDGQQFHPAQIGHQPFGRPGNNQYPPGGRPFDESNGPHPQPGPTADYPFDRPAGQVNDISGVPLGTAPFGNHPTQRPYGGSLPPNDPLVGNSAGTLGPLGQPARPSAVNDFHKGPEGGNHGLLDPRPFHQEGPLGNIPFGGQDPHLNSDQPHRHGGPIGTGNQQHAPLDGSSGPVFSTTYRPGFPTTARPEFSSTYRPEFSTTIRPGFSTTPRPEFPTTYRPDFPATYRPGISTTPRPGFSSTPRPGFPSTPRPFPGNTPYRPNQYHPTQDGRPFGERPIIPSPQLEGPNDSDYPTPVYGDRNPFNNQNNKLHGYHYNRPQVTFNEDPAFPHEIPNREYLPAL